MSLPLRLHADDAHLELGGASFLVTPDGALFEERRSVLVVADLHLESGAAHARRGRFVPPYDTAATLARLARTVLRHDPATVVCLGDSFHDRRGAEGLSQAARLALAALQEGRDWIWVAGNHDPAPPDGVGGRAATEWRLGGIVLRHQPGNAAENEIAGHLHPVAVVQRPGVTVRRRCVAADNRRAVLPAFGAYTGGLDLRHGAFSGLFDRKRFVAFALGETRVWPLPASACL